MTVIPIDQQQRAADAALMRELSHLPEWACLSKHIHAMIVSEIEQILSGPRDEREQHIGIVAGLRWALHLPERIIQNASQ